MCRAINYVIHNLKSTQSASRIVAGHGPASRRPRSRTEIIKNKRGQIYARSVELTHGLAHKCQPVQNISTALSIY